MTALLEYPDPVILHLLGFLLYNFVAVTLLLFKLSKGTATMISLSTHQFSSYFYLIQNSQAVKKVCGPQKGYGEKRCEIQGGGQEMAVMVG